MPQHSESSPIIILVRPQMPDNIGAAMRAMANFGLSELRVINPREGWPHERALTLASGAADRVDVDAHYSTLKDALHDITRAYATTARTRAIEKPIYTPDTASGDMMRYDGRIAFVFGPERTGLNTDETAMCDALITVPTAPDFASLNLAQCVLLVSAAWFNATNPTPQNQRAPAPREAFEALCARLEGALDGKGFFTEDNLRPHVTRNLRTALQRADFTEQELRTLHGVISAFMR